MATAETPAPSPQQKQITDVDQIDQICAKMFSRMPVHLIDNRQRHVCHVSRYENLQLEISHSMAPALIRTLLLETEHSSMLLECAVLGKNSGTEIVKPRRLTVMQRGVRLETRVAVSPSASNTVTNVLPHNEFYQYSAATNANRDKLMQQYATALKGLVPESRIKIDLQKSNRLSVRMKALQDFNLPVFAPRMVEQRQGDDLSVMALPAGEHQRIMRSDALPGDYIGEICEPLFYKKVFIFGYVQILSLLNPATLSQYHSVRQLTRRLEADLQKNRCFPQNALTGQLADISHGGMGFVHPAQRSALSPAALTDRIVLDVAFDATTVATFSGKIKNMNTEERGKRYGIEFEFLSADCESLLARATGGTSRPAVASA